ncbi:MAG: methyltransferase family protein [Anaerolineae bacterium]
MVTKRQLIRAAIGFAAYLLLAPALMFLAAGTTRWPTAWAYTLIMVVGTIISRLLVWRTNPDTLRERAKFASAENTKPWDRALVVIVGIGGPVTCMVVAGLDYRWGWSPEVPLAWQVAAAVAVTAAVGISVWAMVANAYFSAVARIQSDRGQQVVTSGPYAVVRHPSYASAVLLSVVMPVMLGTLWAWVPQLGVIAALVIRTRLEDRMLREELEGYEAYAEEVRWRLVPGVW